MGAMASTTLIALTGLGAALFVAALAVVALVLRDPVAATHRVESLFRRPPSPAKAPGRRHYYKAYWS
jgi:hypothetical protein